MKALIIGIDGVRLDMLERARTPHLDAVADLGGRKRMMIDDRGRSVSGPMWSTVLTGAWPDEHGVLNNQHVPATRMPDVLTRLRVNGLAHMPIAIATWPPLTSSVGCGPIINPTHVRTFAAPLITESTDEYREWDETAARVSSDLLGVTDVDAAFVYFGLVDEIGHSRGVGADYIAAIEEIDAHIGRVLAALNTRPDRNEWAVVITTDHGHTEGGSHGGTSAEECTVWVISDHASLLAQIDAPHEIAGAIEALYRPDR